ncbi:hypothetical protein C2845_PM05G07920 [Panicum miliaceum]|uniref:Uncharacterized protein n=1 Tax=Panicum miliaceum TaxID=4540 RepID=A0A3L6SW31_PANMI|nr:hypothetical protein C2845_PM05G07920 [Panicum miliaceum]
MVPVHRDRGGQGPAAAAVGCRSNRLSVLLLLIISRVAGDTADLVRCAATASTDAAFICLHAPPRTDQSARGLALGCFLSHPDKIEFVPLPSASRRIGALGPPSLDLLVDDEGRRIFDASSRVVASHGGRLVVEIRPTTSGRFLELGVCNPVSGEVDNPGPNSCASPPASPVRESDEMGEDKEAAGLPIKWAEH